MGWIATKKEEFQFNGLILLEEAQVWVMHGELQDWVLLWGQLLQYNRYSQAHLLIRHVLDKY